MQTHRFRPFALPFKLALCLLAAVMVYRCCAWLSGADRKISAAPAITPAECEHHAPAVAKTRIENKFSISHIALENARQNAANSKKHAAAESRRWASGAVLAGQKLIQMLGRVTSEQGICAGGGDLPVKPMPVNHSTGDKTETGVLTKRDLPIITRRENIAQFQSRFLSGALDLQDEQWRQVDRTLAAYYQEGFTRHLDREARPPKETDAWQRQRADLSRRAFAAVTARLTPEQAVRFQKLYQGETWLWAVGSGI